MAKSDIILADALAELVVEYKLAFTNFTLNDQFTLNLYKRCHEVPLQQHLTMQKAPVLVHKRDYTNKLRIAFKERREVKQTINILFSLSPDTEQIQMFTLLFRKADRLAATLYTCCRNAEAKFK